MPLKVLAPFFMNFLRVYSSATAGTTKGGGESPLLVLQALVGPHFVKAPPIVAHLDSLICQ